jgi:site-specific DNA-cytosine methylase
LNVMDNTGDTRATVLILFEPKSAFEENWGESQVKNALRANASKSSHIVFYGNRVDDIRIQGDVINTLQARMGTGGGNMPIVSFDTQFGSNANTFEDVSPTLKHSQQPPSVVGPLTSTGMSRARGTETVESRHYEIQGSTVRRLTPTECERLQGFPDNWTEDQADTHRYKQMGNAVAVPVVSWIVNRLMGAESDLD